MHGDHLGSASLTTDQGGGVYAQQRYYPYGEVRWQSGTLPTDRQFTGQRNDGYIKLTQMGARWYSEKLGRWISADSIIPDPTNPQDLNRYAYVRNNPVKHTDPTGHCIFGLDTVVCLAVGGAIVGALIGYGTEVYQNMQQGMEFKDALTTNINPESVIGGAFLGGAAGAALPLVATVSGLATAGTVAVTTELMDGDADEIHIAERVADAAQSAGFDIRQVQHVYSNHAGNFGFTENWNTQVGQEFEQTLLEHVTQFSDQAIQGTYRGTMQVIHYFDPSTNLDVMLDLNGNLVSGWQLSPEQVYYLLNTGNVQ